METNVLFGFVRTLWLFAAGRVNFHPESRNRTLRMEDGKTFTVFRHVTITQSPGMTDPEAVFMVRFKPANMTVEKNIKFSLLPMMIFMGFKGFRAKFWAVDRETGLCQGLYEWQTMRDAENYSRSIAMKFMSRRSVPESVTHKILQQSGERYWAFKD